jgi:hypothetical protein
MIDYRSDSMIDICHPTGLLSSLYLLHNLPQRGRIQRLRHLLEHCHTAVR